MCRPTAQLRDKIAGLIDGEWLRRNRDDLHRSHRLPTTVDPVHFGPQFGFGHARVTETVLNESAPRIGQQASREDAVGIGRANDFVGGLELDLLNDRFREPLAQIATIAVGLDHRYVDRSNVGRVERLGTGVVTNAAT
jgi:hypothetical protein